MGANAILFSLFPQSFELFIKLSTLFRVFTIFSVFTHSIFPLSSFRPQFSLLFLPSAPVTLGPVSVHTILFLVSAPLPREEEREKRQKRFSYIDHRCPPIYITILNLRPTTCIHSMLSPLLVHSRLYLKAPPLTRSSLHGPKGPPAIP